MARKLPDILSEAEEGFVDLVFAITAHEKKPDGAQVFRAEAIHQDEHVGLQIEMSPKWKAGTLGEDVPAFSGVVTYRSLGGLSDGLVSLMGRLYRTKTKSAPKSMRASVKFAGITLGDDPRAIASNEVHIKLFFEHEDEGRYAEVYTNIDLPNKRIQIREKDEGYREALLRALSE